MAFLEKVGNLKAQSDAIQSRMVMVGMELQLGIWVVGVFGPLDGVAHTFHDS